MEKTKFFRAIDLADEREDYCEEMSDFLLSFLIPKNSVTALMCSNSAPEGLARTETAVVMSALSTAKRILYISLTEDTYAVEKKFRTLPYEYMIPNSRIVDDYEKKSIFVCGRDKGSVSLFEEYSANFNRYVSNKELDLVVIDDIVEAMQENHISSRELIKEIIRTAEQTNTTILYTADTRYSDHAMLSLPCSVIDVERKSITDGKENKNKFQPFPDYEIIFRNEKNEFLFDTNLHEYGNWIRLDELCTYLLEYSTSL